VIKDRGVSFVNADSWRLTCNIVNFPSFHPNILFMIVPLLSVTLMLLNVHIHLIERSHQKQSMNVIAHAAASCRELLPILGAIDPFVLV
jgi:hypothetical protein